LSDKGFAAYIYLLLSMVVSVSDGPSIVLLDIVQQFFDILTTNIWYAHL